MARYQALRAVFVDNAGLRSTAYSRLEAAQGKLSELERAQRLGTPVRIEEGHLLPSKSRTVRTGLRGTIEEFSQAARQADADWKISRKDVETTYRYNLFTRNRVTELIRTVNESFENREAGRQRLGGALLAPVDRGKLLMQSLRGMLYSLPEITFFNIRKGSFPSALEAPGERP